MIPEVKPKDACHDLRNFGVFSQVLCANSGFLGNDLRRHQRSKVRIVFVQVHRSNVLYVLGVSPLCVERNGLKGKTLLAVDENSKVVQVKRKFFPIASRSFGSFRRFRTRVPNFCRTPVKRSCKKVAKGHGTDFPVRSLLVKVVYFGRTRNFTVPRENHLELEIC